MPVPLANPAGRLRLRGKAEEPRKERVFRFAWRILPTLGDILLDLLNATILRYFHETFY